MTTKTILVDFDGVIHSYTSGWQGANLVADPPVSGAINWLSTMVGLMKNGAPVFEVCIYSSRSRQVGGIGAMTSWLIDNGLGLETLKRILFPTQKPPAFLTIDDRCIRFEGVFPTPHEVESFRPWNHREV